MKRVQQGEHTRAPIAPGPAAAPPGDTALVSPLLQLPAFRALNERHSAAVRPRPAEAVGGSRQHAVCGATQLLAQFLLHVLSPQPDTPDQRERGSSVLTLLYPLHLGSSSAL